MSGSNSAIVVAFILLPHETLKGPSSLQAVLDQLEALLVVRASCAVPRSDVVSHIALYVRRVPDRVLRASCHARSATRRLASAGNLDLQSIKDPRRYADALAADDASAVTPDVVGAGAVDLPEFERETLTEGLQIGRELQSHEIPG